MKEKLPHARELKAHDVVVRPPLTLTRRAFHRTLAVGASTLHASLFAGAPHFLVGCTPPPTKSQTVREVSAVVAGQPSRDGAGVSLTRLLGSRELSMLDPFLMLDEFRSLDPDEFMPGFPRHPHRGFETVTIMFDGHVVHEDSLGNRGDISGGGVQWMTAGRGIIHSEMPRPSETNGGIWGYQLWVNLPAAKKMCIPRYQDMSGAQFTTTPVDDAAVRVLAGRVNGVSGGITDVHVKPMLLDVQLEAGGKLRLPVPMTHTSFLVVTEGRVGVGERQTSVSGKQLATLARGDVVSLVAHASSRLLVVAGVPIGEPVARRGPFVMNTDDEIRQAFEDHRQGRLVDG